MTSFSRKPTFISTMRTGRFTRNQPIGSIAYTHASSSGVAGMPSNLPLSSSQSVANLLPTLQFIKNFIDEWTNISIPGTLKTADFTPFLPQLSEAFLFEDILQHIKSSQSICENQEKRDGLEKLQAILLPLIRKFRTAKATQKLTQLVASFLKGPEEWDQTINALLSEAKVDIHLIQLLDAKIVEAHLMFSKVEQVEATSERILRAIRDRIEAQKLMENRGSVAFVQLLSQYLHAGLQQKTEILKVLINKIEDIERCHCWLKDGIAYAESSGKMSPKQVEAMKLFMKDLMKLHPVRAQKLNKQKDIDYLNPLAIDLDQALKEI
ncbi:hypothetical protein IE077_002058 [Cardiosporidium cionae]|uniref:Uncharacterized protein n=1 Tax=Cardiosporidium cionae TaxID=476202 RepID=A0ABQ7JG22_9APIC|nr:hypothetical protein IE077_002058 [Cardiosporidium cionae]|eukprot:KAF8822918.1 hypothetical protein IE077_002058 [Cardiosporidium cionae]